MSTQPPVIEYATPVQGIDHLDDGGVRITLPPCPGIRLVLQTLELVVGGLLCAGLAFALLNAGNVLLAAILLAPALLTLRRFGVFIRHRQSPRTIELADGTLHVRHLPFPGHSRRLPTWTVIAVRAA